MRLRYFGTSVLGVQAESVKVAAFNAYQDVERGFAK